MADAIETERKARTKRMPELSTMFSGSTVKGYSSVLDLPTELAGLLRYPCTGRVRSAAGKVNASTAEFDEKQYIHCLQPRRFDRKEVASDDLVLVVRQKRLPAAPMLASFGRWWHLLALEHILNC